MGNKNQKLNDQDGGISLKYSVLTQYYRGRFSKVFILFLEVLMRICVRFFPSKIQKKKKCNAKPQLILRCVCQTKQNRTMYTLKPANEQHTLQWWAAKTPVQDFCFPATMGDVKAPEQSPVQ